MALPPTLHSCGTLRALYPSEPTGGTWIGTNERGLTFALINWYSKPQFCGAPAFSRGAIIPKLLSTRSHQDAEAILRDLPLTRIHPFRLIIVSVKEQSLHEFRSDTVSLEKVSLPWEKYHWFSSGFDEQEAMRHRRQTCCQEIDHPGSHTITRLRNLHRSHAPEKGPFSICMHREDAITVSYTEVTIKNHLSTLSYHEGAPCKDLNPTIISLLLDSSCTHLPSETPPS